MATAARTGAGACKAASPQELFGEMIVRYARWRHTSALSFAEEFSA